MAPVLTAKNLTLRFPGAETPTLRDFSIEIERGAFVALVGGSGVGKSTLLRAIAGLLDPESGTVALSSPERAGQRRRAIVFQDGRLLPWRSLAANVEYGLEGLSLPAAERRARIDEVLSLTRLDHLADRYPHQLSGGQVQRAGIARALAVRPDVLLMDEPFSAVDALTRGALQDELLRIWEASGAAILFVTHDIAEAALMSQRVVVLAGQPASIVRDTAVTLPLHERRARPGFAELVEDIQGAL
ncbi:ABC transporter ATP-binding protein [Profundibacterium mesophilum]|uniref:ABC transporter nucleotide bindingATPase protein n=1 Tax=Profundibacterium mesophilum KAUST100406-0324 TaxID=1037889 RepID=A0A921TE41_9RHOB|nr:ABC transporter ATP-binding protein [Profundibacterium mesophilum]KAF0675014.1 ABC transporter nucleotide bindingATPase protein [Profundibacterium mesophilum KAUST100406-0324]